MAILRDMKSSHKKTRQSVYRSFPDLVNEYSRAIEDVAQTVRHVDGNDLGISHPVEYLYAHLVMLDAGPRADFLRLLRRSYQTWLEQRELKPSQDAPGSAQKGIAVIGPLGKTDSHHEAAKPPAKPKRR